MVGLSFIVSASIVSLFSYAIWKSNLSANLAPPTVKGETIPLGKALFTEFLLPFEIVSVLLLVAMVGVVLLSKKELK
jgi:NADH:ubiquinone oxidoreductase subunit 6 (subunit J)